MDTKWKNLTERQWKRLMFAGVVAASVLGTLVCILIRYQILSWYWGSTELQKIFKASVTLAVLFLLTAGGLLHQYFRYRKSGAIREQIHLSAADRFPSEGALALLLISGIWWLYGIYGPYTLVWNRYMLWGAIDIIRVVLILTVTTGCFWGCCVLLYRKRVLGVFREHSLILQLIRNYRNRTPWERQLQNRNRAGMIVAVILTGLSFFYMAEGGVFLSVFELVLGCVSILLLFILFVRFCYFGKWNREIGVLVQRITAMSQGETPEEEAVLPESSLLYEAYTGLQQIDDAMRKSIQKQVQAEKLKVDLITNVSHDLKTPLTSMVGYTDLLKKEELSEEARDYVEVISRKQEQLRDMIQDLFELSKSTSGAEQFKTERLDMRRLVEQTMGNMEDVIADSGFVIRTEFGEEPLPFLGDNGKMHRVVQNLLENALKYSLQGTRIYLGASAEKGRVKMWIKNISAYEMNFSPEEITERFVRGDTSRTTKGHGLGLAIASSYVGNMGGTLEISIDGDLFKVELEFPLAK